MPLAAGKTADDQPRDLEMGQPAEGARPFGRLEWKLAGRYLRARRKEGFISVIAGFSFLGIMLGVATLIIVMAVMNGFRNELLGKILGLNGHVIINSALPRFTDYDQLAALMRKQPFVRQAIPLIEGQVMVSTPAISIAALVRGIRGPDLRQLKALQSEPEGVFTAGRRNKIIKGSLIGFEANPPSIAIGSCC